MGWSPNNVLLLSGSVDVSVSTSALCRLKRVFSVSSSEDRLEAVYLWWSDFSIRDWTFMSGRKREVQGTPPEHVRARSIQRKLLRVVVSHHRVMTWTSCLLYDNSSFQCRWIVFIFLFGWPGALPVKTGSGVKQWQVYCCQLRRLSPWCWDVLPVLPLSVCVWMCVSIRFFF